jgi:hypothetical protein
MPTHSQHIYHLAQSGIRLHTSHQLVFSEWYPFDSFSSPGYELVIIIQVILNFIASHGSHGIQETQKLVSWRIKQLWSGLSKIYIKLKLFRGAPEEPRDPVTSWKSMNIWKYISYSMKVLHSSSISGPSRTVGQITITPETETRLHFRMDTYFWRQHSLFSIYKQFTSCLFIYNFN